MKRLLSLLATLTISTPVALSVAACGHSQDSGPVYNSVEDGIKSLKLNSYALINAGVQDVTQLLTVDLLSNLIKLKFIDAVKLNYLFVNINKSKIIDISKIIKSDGSLLDANDLTTTKTLKIQIICKVGNEFVFLNNITLNIIENNKTDQEVVDYMLQLNFNSILTSSNFSNFAGYQLDFFKENFFPTSLVLTGCSYFLTIFNKDKISNPKLINVETGAELSQNDINQSGNLKLKFNFDYGDVKNQSLTFNINLVKFNFTQFDMLFNFNTINVKVKNPENLSEDDVTEIYVSIIEQILKTIKSQDIYYWTIDDFAIQGIEKIVYEGADFSVTKLIVFDMVAQPNSKMLMGTLKNNFITVNVTAS